MPSVLVPPRRDRSGCPVIRSVPCSMRCTGRPRPIPGGGSTRCMTRSAAATFCGARGSRCAGTTARRASTRSPWPQVEEYGVDPAARRAGRRAEGGPVPSAARPAGYIPKPGVRDGAEAVVDSSGSRPDRAGRGEDRARAGLRGGLPAVQLRVPPEAVAARCPAGAHRRVRAGPPVGGRDGHRELLFRDSARQVDASGRGTRLRPAGPEAAARDAARRGDGGRAGAAPGRRRPRRAG